MLPIFEPLIVSWSCAFCRHRCRRRGKWQRCGCRKSQRCQYAGDASLYTET